jgi:hypothetical protein
VKREEIAEAAKLLATIDRVGDTFAAIEKDKGSQIHINLYDGSRTRNYGQILVPKGEAVKLIEASTKAAKARLKEIGVKV